MPHRGPRFDVEVKPGGYVWWYIDGLSEDGQFGFSVIAFIGSVFSPYYYWKSRANPLDHCAINVALYGPGTNRWTMTERGRRHVEASAQTFRVGPSQLHWTGEELIVNIREWSAPLPRRVIGQICLRPHYLSNCAVALADGGIHRWWPIAPSAEVELRFEKPDLSWRGEGYFDSNAGDEALEDRFASWDWARFEKSSDGNTEPAVNRILYDVRDIDGDGLCLGLNFDDQGKVEEFRPPSKIEMSRPFWRVRRTVRGENGAQALKTLEDTPFYTRSMIRTTLEGKAVQGMHESLDLDRFRRPIVKAMLPFRMPRRP